MKKFSQITESDDARENRKMLKKQRELNIAAREKREQRAAQNRRVDRTGAPDSS